MKEKNFHFILHYRFLLAAGHNTHSAHIVLIPPSVSLGSFDCCPASSCTCCCCICVYVHARLKSSGSSQQLKKFFIFILHLGPHSTLSSLCCLFFHPPSLIFSSPLIPRINKRAIFPPRKTARKFSILRIYLFNFGRLHAAILNILRVWTTKLKFCASVLVVVGILRTVRR